MGARGPGRTEGPAAIVATSITLLGTWVDRHLRMVDTQISWRPGRVAAGAGADRPRRQRRLLPPGRRPAAQASDCRGGRRARRPTSTVAPRRPARWRWRRSRGDSPHIATSIRFRRCRGADRTPGGRGPVRETQTPNTGDQATPRPFAARRQGSMGRGVARRRRRRAAASGRRAGRPGSASGCEQVIRRAGRGVPRWPDAQLCDPSSKRRAGQSLTGYA
jgi:hypothetical protein